MRRLRHTLRLPKQESAQMRHFLARHRGYKKGGVSVETPLLLVHLTQQVRCAAM
jgi:hypothetical protein